MPGADRRCNRRNLSSAVKLIGRGNGPVHEAGNWNPEAFKSPQWEMCAVQECHLAFLQKWAPACSRCKAKCLRINIIRVCERSWRVPQDKQDVMSSRATFLFFASCLARTNL